MNCPYIDENESRCSECLNMRNLEGAFELCIDQYRLCSHYLDLSRAQPARAGTARLVKQKSS